jgi:hypothetical protein
MRRFETWLLTRKTKRLWYLWNTIRRNLKSPSFLPFSWQSAFWWYGIFTNSNGANILKKAWYCRKGHTPIEKIVDSGPDMRIVDTRCVKCGAFLDSQWVHF